MRIFLILFFGIPFLCKAQVAVSVMGGLNTTFLQATPQESSFVEIANAYAWQLGAKAEWRSKKQVNIFSGIFYQTNQFQSNYAACCYIGETDVYRTEFLKIPVGIGYTINNHKKFAISFSSGGYALFGIGGTIRKYGDIGDLISNPFDYTTFIKYGNDYRSDLVRINWGLELGTTLKYKKLKAELLYDYGLSNILPNSYSFGRPLAYKLRTLQLNLGYEIRCVQ